MKPILIFVLLLASLIVSAGETSTQCPMMRDSNDRSNPKENLSIKKIKSKKGAASSQ